MFKTTEWKIIGAIIIIIGITYLGLKIWVINNVNMEQIPVLAYHNIVPDESYVKDGYTVTVDNFEKQLNYLDQNGYNTLTLEEFYNWKKNNKRIPEKSVLLTFDDGFYNIYYLARPILKKHNYHGSLFMIGNVTFDTTKSFDPKEYSTIGLDIINKPDDTLEYQSHTYDMHIIVDGKPKVASASKKEIEEDFEKMKNLLHSGYLVYPYYMENSTIREVLKEYNYKLAFRGESEKTVKSANEYQIPRIEIGNDFEHFKSIFETTKYNNRYENGLLRKVFINIERKLNIRLF